MHLRKFYTVLFISYLLVLLTLLSIPTGEKIDLDVYFLGIRTDHYIHASLFTPFMVLMWLLKGNKIKTSGFFKLFLMGIFFAISCEILHYFIPYRTFDFQDILANVAGICIGSMAFLLGKKNVLNEVKSLD